MPYKTIQNSTLSEGLVKKSTFLPYLVRVLASIAVKRVFKCCDSLIHYPIVLYLFVTLFGFETCNFAPFFILFIYFVICFKASIGAKRKYGIDTLLQNMERKKTD